MAGRPGRQLAGLPLSAVAGQLDESRACKPPGESHWYRTMPTAANLVDNVIPHAPVRQWVLPRPVPLRLLLFMEAPAPTGEALRAVLHKITTRTMKLLTRCGALVDEQDSTSMADAMIRQPTSKTKGV